ncbi:MAG: glycoside hydrolase [Chitinophagaceae bacterium]
MSTIAHLKSPIDYFIEMRTYLIAFTSLLFLLAIVHRNSGAQPFSSDKKLIEPGSATNLLVIDLTKAYQTIHSFGASDCWTAKFAGNWKDEKKKNAIADLLFSTEKLADGSPKGIGLSLWRFNIGAGSAEQGPASGIPDDYRREECFLGADASYNWRKQRGAQWFAGAAKKRGVKYLLAFTNSPPVRFTKNGFSYGLSDNNFNCKEDKYAAFASFLVAVCKHFNATNIPFDYISPVNEPQWKWGERPAQEGTGATNEQTARLIKILGPKLQAAGLTTRITAGEAARVNFLTDSNALIGNQLNDFFNPASSHYIGAVPNTAPVMSYHSYFSTCPDSVLLATRSAVNEKRKQVDPRIQLWQSEFGVLGDICGNLNGGPRNTDIRYGLYVAKVIHTDLVVAGVSSFQWWLAINPYNYSDGLVYINAPDGSIHPGKSKEDGMVSSSKQLWCMGNYSRFIRPGMQRISAAFSGPADCLVSAYKNVGSSELVMVVANNSAIRQQLQLQFSPGVNSKSLDSYTTDATQDMQHAVVSASDVVVAPMSVTTFVTKYKK